MAIINLRRDEHSFYKAQYQNGTIHHVSLAPATPDYIDLMTELSRTTHASPSNLISRTLRRLNKRLGRPSTPAVGTLSTLISALRTATEAHLPTLDRVVVTAPQFPGLTREDLRDAIEYSGLRSWLEYPLPYPTMLYTLNAAYAGTGRGLCKDWRDIYSCWEEAEEGEIPLETVLGITYTNKTLSAAVARVAYAFEKSPGMHAAWPELGWDEKKRVDEEGRDLYWRDVATRLRSFVQEAEEKGRKVSSLVLMGENAGMQEFQDVLKEALALRGAEIMHVDTAVDPTWAASTGAAMYARVRQEVPWNCRAPDHCDESGAGADEDIKFQVEL
ncbi:MAG: hypothetical protein M1820_003689 [Bogoriella megaspora]|nr:MAG: hypothetical protein M1820_003689 [Bogoriella megaspora]